MKTQQTTTTTASARPDECAAEVARLKADCESKRLTPYVDWQTWASCLPQWRVDQIAIATGFRIGDTFDPRQSEAFNRAVNLARAAKLGLIP